MGKVIVIEFVTLDGIIEDPDGTRGMPGGGWAFRTGPQAVTGDKFALGPIMASGVLLLGRRTWDLFAARWPQRTGDFADAMNAMAKVVVSHRAPDLDLWSGSSHLDGDLIDGVARLAGARDVVVAGSIGVVHQLAAADVVDEYRLLTFPVALGAGARLFDAPTDLALVSTEPGAEAVLTRYERVRPLVGAPSPRG